MDFRDLFRYPIFVIFSGYLALVFGSLAFGIMVGESTFDIVNAGLTAYVVFNGIYILHHAYTRA